jgi:hypothetical protein
VESGVETPDAYTTNADLHASHARFPKVATGFWKKAPQKQLSHQPIGQFPGHPSPIGWKKAR